MIAFPPGFSLSGHPGPEHLGDPTEEYVAVGCGCGILPAPWERLLLVEGEEATEFLQAMLTQDVAGLPPGGTLPAALADRRGRWLGDLWVHREEERFLLRVREDRAPVLIETFARHRFSTKVAWAEAAPASRPCLLVGPGARKALAALGVADAGEPRRGGRLAPAAGGFWMQVREVSPQDVVLFPPEADEPQLRARLAGSNPAPRGVGAAAFHARRIEAGTPWHGLDGDETGLVAECVPEDRVSFTKGCFLGQETLARVHYRGRLRRRLARLVIAPGATVRWGEPLLEDDGTIAGSLRSAAQRPDGAAVAFALREAGARASRVQVGGASGRWMEADEPGSAPSA